MARTPFGGPAGLIVLFALAACDSNTTSPPPADLSCSDDSECPEDQSCRLVANDRLLMVFNPCLTVRACTETAMCGTGMVCAPYVPVSPFPGCPARTCAQPCSVTGCPADQVCASSGLCEFQRCDEPGAPTCAETYRCDPAAAAMPVPVQVSGAIGLDALDPAREAQRGCVRKLCDEPGGFTCNERWTCAPGTAPEEGSGCAPLACTETGQCSDDTLYICEPENDGHRPPNTDPHGCVRRNCGEGFECKGLQGNVNYAYCDLASPDSDQFGCSYRSCREVPEACNEGHACDPESTSANVLGCRRLDCSEPGSIPCSSGLTCVPVNGAGGTHTCQVVPTGTGGSGAGGAIGTAGAGGAVLPAGGAGSGTGGTTPGGGRNAAGAGGRASGAASSTGGSSSNAPAPAKPGLCAPRQ